MYDKLNIGERDSAIVLSANPDGTVRVVTRLAYEGGTAPADLAAGIAATLAADRDISHYMLELGQKAVDTGTFGAEVSTKAELAEIAEEQGVDPQAYIEEVTGVTAASAGEMPDYLIRDEADAYDVVWSQAHDPAGFQIADETRIDEPVDGEGVGEIAGYAELANSALEGYALASEKLYARAMEMADRYAQLADDAEAIAEHHRQQSFYVRSFAQFHAEQAGELLTEAGY